MDLARFREIVRQAQEPQGYFFNADGELVTELLEGSREPGALRLHGLPVPARLGRTREDRDIMCPCVYRPPDVMEYGAATAGSTCRRRSMPARFPSAASPNGAPREVR